MKAFAKHIFAAGAIVFFAASCQENNPIEIEKANPGDEVVFGVNLPAKTKTVYGGETHTGFPIYWVNGDKVRVASPQCLSGRNSAEYSVAVESETQNYATSLTKTGEVGIQWGEAKSADFYSIYPSTGASLSISGTDVTASLSIANTQTATPRTKDLVYEPADMKNVVMLAKTKDVSQNPVELNYVPFSTVIEFAIPGPTNAGEMGASDVIIVQTLTLTAPDGTKIAGDFDFSLGELGNTATAGSTANLAATNVRNASNSIIVHLLDKNSAYATVHAGETLKVKTCLIPQPYTSLEGWTVTVKTNDGNYTKTIKGSELNSDPEKNKLKSGYVHKVSLPALNYKGEWTPNLDNWIPELPDYTNIYLSEISLPGAWYAGSTETYQETSDIARLWNAGVRAFAVECRTNSEYINTSTSWIPNYKWVPQNICISGTGRNPSIGNGYADGTNITTVIESIKTSLAAHPNEYAVLVLSYADGGTGGHRDEDHAFFLKGIADALSGYSDIIYGSKITANTTVNDVKGKLIIKVNVDNNIPIGNYAGMNSLISYNPFLSQMEGADYARPYYSNLYWSDWANSYKSYDLVANLSAGTGNENRFVWVFSSANRTQANTGIDTTIPTYAQRQAALEAMMTYSKTIYDASTHNVWFYFNCGGTLATSSTSPDPSPKDFASTMNSWLLSTINSKTAASPLGIVMFNQCTNPTYDGPAIIDAIVKMNAKFYLKHAGDGSGSTGGNTTPVAQNDSTLENGGNAI